MMDPKARLARALASLGRAFMVRDSVDQRDRRRGSDRARGTLCRCLLTEAAGVLTGCWARLPALAAAPIPPPAASQPHNAAPISPPSVGKTTRPAVLCSQRDMAHGLPTPRTTLRTGYVRVLVWVQVLPPSARCRSASPGRRRQGRRAAGPSDDASGHADPGVAGTNCGLGDGGWPAAGALDAGEQLHLPCPAAAAVVTHPRDDVADQHAAPASYASGRCRMVPALSTSAPRRAPCRTGQ